MEQFLPINWHFYMDIIARYFMRKPCEIDRLEILARIDSVEKTIINRLLPTFDSIDEESQQAINNQWQLLTDLYDPKIYDESELRYEASHVGYKHYLIVSDMKQEFLKFAITWFFHLFEKDCTFIFETEDGDLKLNILNEISMNTKKDSDWHTCNKELRCLANAIKHGSGKSLTTLKKLRPDFFIYHASLFSNDKINITTNDINKYLSAMKRFWSHLSNDCEPR